MTISISKLGSLPYLQSLCLWAAVQMVSAGTNKLRLHLLFFRANLKNSSKNGLSAAEASTESVSMYIFLFTRKSLFKFFGS
jgi:hypothetical protein